MLDSLSESVLRLREVSRLIESVVVELGVTLKVSDQVPREGLSCMVWDTEGLDEPTENIDMLVEVEGVSDAEVDRERNTWDTVSPMESVRENVST